VTGRDRLRELLDAVLDEDNRRVDEGDPITWSRERYEP
jgi:hypothetical protein